MIDISAAAIISGGAGAVAQVAAGLGEAAEGGQSGQRRRPRPGGRSRLGQRRRSSRVGRDRGAWGQDGQSATGQRDQPGAAAAWQPALLRDLEDMEQHPGQEAGLARDKHRL